MGWSGQGLEIHGGGPQASASALPERIWREIAYPLWRRRALYSYHERLVLSEYGSGSGGETIRFACEPLRGDAPGFSLYWMFYDHGPDDLFQHWLSLALAYHLEKVSKLIKASGFTLASAPRSLPEQLYARRHTLYLDVGSEVVMVSTHRLELHEDVTVWYDLDRGFLHRSLEEMPLHQHKQVHQVIERGLCECFLCHDLRLNVDPPLP